ncbi:MAG: transposase, partial [Waddliaceae bacterium]
MHGKSKRRRWKKFHVGVCPETHEIITGKAAELEKADCKTFSELVEGAPRSIRKIAADGAYGTEEVHRLVHRLGMMPCIPP